MLESELAALSDPTKDQYFLTNPRKLSFILEAADIQETDRVIEIGAGAGTVARVLPRCTSLTLIELDERLIPALRSNAPTYATVLNTDGLELLRRGQLQADVILGNLPTVVAAELASLLPQLRFRVAVIAAGSVEPFAALAGQLDHVVLTEITGEDFTPPQPGVSLLVAVYPRG